MVSIELRQIIDFVEGRLQPKDFEQILYANPRFEEVLNDDPNFPPNTYLGTELYLYVIQLNFNSPGDILNLQKVLADFLERNGFAHQSTKKFDERYDLILSAQPKWLDVDSEYVQSEIIPAAGDLTGNELKQWLRAEFLKRFRYITKPPRWIQNPNWPINENGPLIFLGQLQVKDYFHDEAAIYVFHDQKSDSLQTIRQTH